MTFPAELRLSVPFHAEGGFIGRQCGGADCARVFKVHKDDLADEMHCPYCGDRFTKEDLLTADQSTYLRKVIDREVLPILQDEVSQRFRKAFSGPGWTFTPGTPPPRPTAPEPPIDPATDSELTCPSCKTRFQVDGIFGYCPGCKSENLLLYDANLAIIKRELATAGGETRKLRHAYADLVSTFEIFCRKEAARLGVTIGRPQNLQAARERFLEVVGVNILAGLNFVEHLDLRRAFQKRHAHEHNGGLIDARYIAAVPEDLPLAGTVADLSVEELERAAMALRKAISAIVDAR